MPGRASRRQQNRRVYRSKMFLLYNHKRARPIGKEMRPNEKNDGLVADSAEIELKRGNAGHFPALFLFWRNGEKQTGDGLQSVDCIVPMGKRIGKEKTGPKKGRLKDR